MMKSNNIENKTMYDVLIVGAGPAGLACAIEAAKQNLRYVVIEKGAIAESIRRYPINMTFFSTPELLTLGGVPFTTTNTRPKRAETLQYYRGVVSYFGLQLRLHTAVESIDREEDGTFAVHITGEEQPLRAKFVVLATGYFDYYNPLGVPGEEFPHVSHYYDEPYKYSSTKVAVVGGRNSAVETALELFRHGAEVTLIHRGENLGDSVKYWVRPDIENRIAKGEIAALFNTVVREITPKYIYLENTITQEKKMLPADFVIAHTGHRPDEKLLRSAGVALDDTTLIAQYNPATFETNVENLYIAGSVACGCQTWNIFIENGRLHGKSIISDICQKVH